MKYILAIFVCCFLFISCVFAESCPTVWQIKNHLFNEWMPVDLDSAEPLSPEELQLFKKNINSFAFAGWLDDAPEGSAECFYYGKEPSSDYLGVFLVKSLRQPDLSQGNWVKYEGGFMKCDKSIENCHFLE